MPSFRPKACLLLALCAAPLLAACEEASYFKMAGYSTRGQLAIDHAFAERNDCLHRNAVAQDTSGSTRNQIAQAVAFACQTQTDHLIAVSNPSGDPRVAAAIRKDSDFRALGYVMKAETASR